MFHAVPGLWRLHRMHHADLDFDAITGPRYHPVEIIISMGIKLAMIAALGPPAVAVLRYEVILDATALFNHAKIDLPRPVDRVLHLSFVRRNAVQTTALVVKPRIVLLAGLATILKLFGNTRLSAASNLATKRPPPGRRARDM